MNGAFIAPYISSELFSAWKRGKKTLFHVNPSEIHAAFQASPYKKILATVGFAKALLQDSSCRADQLCIAFHFNEHLQNQNWLVEMKSQGAVIILLAGELKDIAKLSEPTFFDEIVLFIHRNVDQADINRLSALANLRLLFSYELSQESIIQTLKKFSGKKLVSSYLELSAKAEMSLWYAPESKVLTQSSTEVTSGPSIVIPFQENQHELLACLSSLRESLRHTKNFEVILVDDGHGNDCVDSVAAQFPDFMQHLTYIKLARATARTRGDDAFRAGVARNVGAALSRGAELVFIDSDILLGPSFWQSLEEKRQYCADPVMPRRRQLLSDINIVGRAYKDFNAYQDTQLSWGGHWEQFYRDWQTEPDVWRWTSTYCLSLPRDTFMAVGGFHRAFHCYGFEDTELGYRLYQAGCRLQILDVDTYHLPVTPGRSEYQADPLKKQKVLRQSFQVLLRATLDPRMVDMFQHVIGKR